MATQADAAQHGHHEVHHPYHLVEPSPWPIVGSLSALVLVSGGLMYMHSIAGGPWIMLLGGARPGLHPGPLVARRDPREPLRRSHRRGLEGPQDRHGAVHHLGGAVLLRLLLGLFLGRAAPPGDGRGLHLAAGGHPSGRGLGHSLPQHHDPVAVGLHGDLGASCGARERQSDRDQGAGADRAPGRAVHQLPGLRVRPHDLQPGGLPDLERHLSARPSTWRPASTAST